MPLPTASLEAPRLAFSAMGATWGQRVVPEETAIALTYNQSSYAVMMATPSDLEDFGLGFSLTEGIVCDRAELLGTQIVPLELGLEIRMELTPSASDRTTARRRRIAGPVGCGLCGVESLAEAMRPLPQLASRLSVNSRDVQSAVRELRTAQTLNSATHAVHAAGFWRQSDGLVAVREDVGRHNALDKLAGVVARRDWCSSEGMVIVSSRVSVDMVQKAVLIGVPILVAISAPTALAVRAADAAGLTLIAVARDDGFEVFSHHDRIQLEA